MIKIDVKNTGIRPKSLSREIKSLRKKKEALFLSPHTQNISEILNFAKKSQKKFHDVVVIGIGGSILGAKTLFETLKSTYWNMWKKPRMFFIDNLDADQIIDLGDILKKEKTLFIVVSKSGETLEIIEILSFLVLALKKKFGKNWKERIAIITGKNEGKLYKFAKAENLKTFLVPREIPGRFSVLTTAGLVPAAIAGIDIKKLLYGASKVKIEGVPSALAYAQYKTGKKITVLFPYGSKFNAFSEWYKQLLAESIGKKKNIGITPLTAIGPKDQHSLLQLLLDGPKDKFILFIEAQSKYKEFSKVISAEKKATEQALTEKKQRNATITLQKIDEENIGQLLYTMEAATALLGELYKVNPFNQPAVEKVKKLTRKILGQN